MSLRVVLERRIIYHTRKSGKVDPWLHLGDQNYLESLGVRTNARVYCMRLDNNKNKIILVPAKNQNNPRANRCYRAILYNIEIRKGRVLRIRLSYNFLKKIGLPKHVLLHFEGDNIIITPQNN